ncbi:MAG TPA: AcrB/AcrD/AcrF family protein [Porphyromonadaceae bacterium]|nr:AcrB/AcrD/AcrF family protein [Porphyromonadaceae bacterium]
MGNKKFDLVCWTMRNYRITFLLVVLFTALGVWALVKMPKQEFPDVVVRQGMVVALYPNASTEEVENQVTHPLERYLMTFKEVKRCKTVSTSKNGMCYIKVELQDYVKDKDEVWSKIKHGLNFFKQSSLPKGVLAVVVKDDFGDSSALLIALSSDTRSYRELKEYIDELSDRLRGLETVTNINIYGNQVEQISLYINKEKLSTYGIGEKALFAVLSSQSFSPANSKVSNDEVEFTIRVSSPFVSEEEVANQVIYCTPGGKIVRVKDIARVVREYPEPESYISYDGHNCLILSTEMLDGNNIIKYGKDIDKILADFTDNYLPEDVSVSRIVDQAKVVEKSVIDFLVNLAESIIVIIVVMMILFPIRSAIVAAVTIPINTFISIGIMYMSGIPLNMVTFAALIVVLGMIVDNTIVVIDGYLEFLNQGYSRWYSAVKSAKKYFMSMLLGTVCVTVIFFPLIITLTGTMKDFLFYFPWALAINLMISLPIAVLVVPFLEVALIKRTKSNEQKGIVAWTQSVYQVVLDWTFRNPHTTIFMGVLSVIASFLMFPLLKIKMLPVAERDQFAVEIYLADGTPISRTAKVADSLRTILSKDERVKSITSFIGCSSPRFQFSYAPKFPSKNYAQFIVNTISNKVTEEILDESSQEVAHLFPDAYVVYKQLDYQDVPTFEFRFFGSDFKESMSIAQKVVDRIRDLPELSHVHLDCGEPSPLIDVKMNPLISSQLGISKAIVTGSLSVITEDVKVGSLWEEDYEIPMIIKNENQKEKPSVEELGNTYVLNHLGDYVLLRQFANVAPQWSSANIVHRGGLRLVTVTADISRGQLPSVVLKKLKKIIEGEILPDMPEGVRFEIGGEDERSKEIFYPIVDGIAIALVIVFFFILFSFKRFGITLMSMLSNLLCLFGAILGLVSSGRSIGLTCTLGFVTLLGIIMKNVILMYQHAEDKCKYENYSPRDAAYDAGKRRMTPIFLTTATTAVGVLPMIIEGSSFWCPVGVCIFAGGIGSLIAVITVLPVLYWKLRSH